MLRKIRFFIIKLLLYVVSYMVTYFLRIEQTWCKSIIVPCSTEPVCDNTQKIYNKWPGITIVAFIPHCQRVNRQRVPSSTCHITTNQWHQVILAKTKAIRFLLASVKQLLQSTHTLLFANHFSWSPMTPLLLDPTHCYTTCRHTPGPRWSLQLCIWMQLIKTH